MQLKLWTQDSCFWKCTKRVGFHHLVSHNLAALKLFCEHTTYMKKMKYFIICHSIGKKKKGYVGELIFLMGPGISF